MAQGIPWSGSCSIAACDRPAKSRGWCRYHYTRWYRFGHPEAPKSSWSKDDPARPSCAIASCGLPYFANNLCKRHDHTRWRNGDAEALAYEWAKATPCKVCGDPPKRFRQFCTTTCRNAWLAYGDDVLLFGHCVRCHERLDFLTVSADGRKRYRVTSFCKPCRTRHNRYGMNVRQLASRDGLDCSLCGEPVDMSLKRSDSLLCPSVDHILPRSLGGGDEPENLALAHLICNIRKSNRVA